MESLALHPQYGGTASSEAWNSSDSDESDWLHARGSASDSDDAQEQVANAPHIILTVSRCGLVLRQLYVVPAPLPLPSPPQPLPSLDSC